METKIGQAIEWLVEMINAGVPLNKNTIEMAKRIEKINLIYFAKECATENLPDKHFKEIYEETFIAK